MTERTTDCLVTFRHAFALSDIVGTQPAGTYQIETVEQRIDSLSFTAFRRISTTIRLPAIDSSPARRQIVDIDPAELAAALHRDETLSSGDRGASTPAPVAASA